MLANYLQCAHGSVNIYLLCLYSSSFHMMGKAKKKKKTQRAFKDDTTKNGK